MKIQCIFYIFAAIDFPGNATLDAMSQNVNYVLLKVNYEQVVQPGGEEWQQMSAAEKKYFRQCAKCCRAASGPYNAYKISDEKDSATKVSHPNSDGNSKRKVKATFCGAMQYSTRNDPQRATTVEIKSIWHLMKNFDVKILENPFYILTVESYEIACKKEIPAEIAFVRFSLKEGIIAAKSFILQPTMRSHKINPLNLCQATNRYRYVAEQIKSLCDSNDPCSFIFTLANDFNEVQRA
uniref:Uncharacterized protein n=1 Tax=Romanomermis culicivorax TaxID=13658 RepID=A0A915I6F3_ROMCU